MRSPRLQKRTLLRPTSEQFAASFDKSITLELRQAFSSRVASSLPHDDRGERIDAFEVIDDAGVITEVIVQELPRALVFTGLVVAPFR